MLQLYKNQVVTSVAKQQVDIRKLELDWYTNNYWTLSQQGALLAGFAFSQISTSLPEGTPYYLETAYLLFAAISLGLQLCVVITTIFCCMWGPGLALRGPSGVRSVHDAIDRLKNEQNYIYFFFILGLLSFYVANILLLWCYFEEWVALSSSLFLLFFFFLIIYYIVYLTYTLKSSFLHRPVEGKIHALRPYEYISDLDENFDVHSKGSQQYPLNSAEIVHGSCCSNTQGQYSKVAPLAFSTSVHGCPVDMDARHLYGSHFVHLSGGGTSLRPDEDIYWMRKDAKEGIGVFSVEETEPPCEVSSYATPHGFLEALSDMFEWI